MRDADSDTRKIAPRGIEPGGSGREVLAAVQNGYVATHNTFLRRKDCPDTPTGLLNDIAYPRIHLPQKSIRRQESKGDYIYAEKTKIRYRLHQRCPSRPGDSVPSSHRHHQAQNRTWRYGAQERNYLGACRQLSGCGSKSASWDQLEYSVLQRPDTRPQATYRWTDVGNPPPMGRPNKNYCQ